MTQGTIEERVKKVVVKALQVNTNDVKPETRFDDKLDHLEVMIGLEEEFDLEILKQDEKRIKTFQDAVDYIKLKRP